MEKFGQRKNQMNRYVVKLIKDDKGEWYLVKGYKRCKLNNDFIEKDKFEALSRLGIHDNDHLVEHWDNGKWIKK